MSALGFIEAGVLLSGARLQVPSLLLLPLFMALPGPYSGVSTLAFVARASAFTFGVVYGSVKLSYLQAKAKAQRKAEAKKDHHH
ncbi:hypothetical protein IEQ34_014297 [Dendrobium chrysotoxum]|nr:hypothetical protein IEQ34_014297 [Dendrobium chrysotoxum]